MMEIQIIANSDTLDVSRIGGKARNLQFLSSMAEIEVPAWFCVTTAVCEILLANMSYELKNTLSRLSILNDDELTALERKLTDFFQNAEFEEEIASTLLREFDRRFTPDQMVAVRSSAVAEDAASASFAGQLESYLNVGRSELLAKIKLCISSAFSVRALSYARRNKIEASKLRGAVIVQKLIESTRSGVIFTCNPISGDRSEFVITAAYGLGEGVVQETAEADTYFVGHKGNLKTCHIQNKEHQVLLDKNNGLRIAEVSSSLRTSSVLKHDDIRSIVRAAKAIESRRDLPQDIEWGLDAQGELHVFQTRDITSRAIRQISVLDSSNIAENYKGAMTPLSLSYVRKYYRDIFRGVAKQFGVNQRLIATYASIFDNLVAQSNSSIYYNLANWYRIFKLIPGFSWFTLAFEYGVSLPPVPAPLEKLRSEALQSDIPFLVKMWTALRVLYIYLRLPSQFKDHHARFTRFRDEIGREDLNALSEDQLRQWLNRLEDQLASHWHTPLVNDYYSFQFFWALEVLSKRWSFSKHELLASISSDSKDALISMESIDALKALANIAKKSPRINHWILENDHNALEKHRIECGEDPFWISFTSFLEQHGDRRFDELKFESPTYEESPAIVYDLLCSHLKAVPKNPIGQQSDPLHNSYQPSPPRSSLLLRFLSGVTRRSMAYREYGRLVRSQRFSVERRLYLAIAQKMVAKGHLVCPMDICYLTVEEVSDYVNGWNATASYKSLVVERKQTFASDLQIPHQERIVVDLNTGFIEIAPQKASESCNEHSTTTLRGSGCSPGVVRGRAHVVIEPRHAIANPGEILVALSTDPAWALLMSAASGLVVERGNILSHAAIIGRELGIPCVIGVPNAMNVITDGELIEIDGNLGTVRRLSS
jgi:rifampicin phosphotransferase